MEIKKVRILRVSFDAEIKSIEIPAFRSAIISKVGRENVLFHHHLDDSKYLYKYPLIQYKSIGRSPSIICIDVGVDEIHKYFEQRGWDIVVNGRLIEMKISRLELNQFVMQVWDKHFSYSIYNWIALNQQNYQKYLKLESMAERISFLENTLKANILAFAKGIDWIIEKQIEVRILTMKDPYIVNVKKNSLMAFNLDFKTNVFLPNFIGLGKSVSKGYGVIRNIKK